jgi:hypothetical protein
MFWICLQVVLVTGDLPIHQQVLCCTDKGIIIIIIIIIALMYLFHCPYILLVLTNCSLLTYTHAILVWIGWNVLWTVVSKDVALDKSAVVSDRTPLFVWDCCCGTQSVLIVLLVTEFIKLVRHECWSDWIRNNACTWRIKVLTGLNLTLLLIEVNVFG